MAAVFPIRTDQPWTFNGVTYEYDATEDRWFVISTAATDSVVEGISNNKSQIDVIDTIIDQEIENRTALLDAAASKNNQQDGAIAELDQRLDAVSDAVGAVAFVSKYTYVLERKDTTCFNAYAACLIDAGGDLASQSACQSAFDECNRAIGDPYPLGSFTSQDTNILDFIENFIITTPDLNGQELDWENLLEVGDYLEVYDEKDFDTALYQVVSPPSAFGDNPGEKIVRVNFLKETSVGDGKLNFQEDYTIRLIKASQGLDLSEADKRYVIKPYVVYFEDTPGDITPVHSSGVLRNGELWFDTSSLELFVWNNNSWVAVTPPPTQDVTIAGVIDDVDRLLTETAQQSQRVNSLVSDLLLESNIYYSDGPPVGDITGTLRNGDLWVDSDDLSIKFYSQGAWINPDRQVGGDYLETTGGKMTGAINSKVGGTNNVALVITDAGNDDQCLNIWAPGGAGQQIKYVGRHNTQHWFQVYDNTNNNPLTTAKFGYETYSFLSKPNVTYSASDAHYFKSNVIFNNGNGDLKAKVSNSNFDFYNLARFQQGFVVKGTGEAITGDNSFAAYPDRVSYSGRMENDTDIVNKKYVDNNSDRFTYVAQNGLWNDTDWQNSANDGKFSAGGQLANGNSFWFFSDIDQNGRLLNLREYFSSDIEKIYIQIGHYSHTYLNDPNVNREGMKIVWAGFVDQVSRVKTGPLNSKVYTPGWELFLNSGTNGNDPIPGSTITSGGTYYIKFGGLL
jgi:hypothetical protein